MPALPWFSELTRQRWRTFRSRRLSYLSLLVLAGAFSLSLFSELLANNVPSVLRYQGDWYFPIAKDYRPELFGQRDTYVVDYRALRARLSPDDWALWPLVFWGPYESDARLESYPAPPGAQHWLGTDDKGRDLLVRLVYGFRISISFALSVWLLSFFLGVGFGAVQGFFGGRLDFYGQRFSEIWSAVPVFFLILTLIVILSPSLLLLVALYSLFGWTHIAQYERAEFLRLRRLDFVDAARALGASPWRIMFRHLLPNALVPLVTFTPFTIAGAITGIAALDYLGFGVPPPTPSWGELLRQALSHFTTAWWIATYTVGAMFATLLLLVFINEGVREAFDPHRRRGPA
jgi:microcin C transport system permease protein